MRVNGCKAMGREPFCLVTFMSPEMTLESKDCRIGHNCGKECQGEKCVFCEVNRVQGYSDDECLGKMLTLVDASISEERQNKALKDLLKQIFRKEQWEKSVSIEHVIASYQDGSIGQSSLPKTAVNA